MPPRIGVSRARGMLRSAILVAALIVAGLAALKALVWTLEPRMAFFPFRGQDRTPAELGIPFQDVTLTTSDGESINAWHLERERPLAQILFWHGNGGNLSMWLDVLAGMHEQNFAVFALDYRGYGKSSGTPSEQGLYRDTEAFVSYFNEHLRAQGVPLIFWGRSLGGAVAAYATKVATPDALVLESAFPDVRSLLRDQPVINLLSVFSSYRFPAAEFLQRFERPILVMHGDRDSIIPFAQGQALFDRLRGPKQLVVLRGRDHNDLHTGEEYWRPVRQLVQQARN